VDFKHPRGREVLSRLIARADVLVENFKPGTLDRLGLGWEALHAQHPRLIYASISGYGQTGPRRNEPGYDAVIQAEGGLMSVTGDRSGPAYRLGVAISDIVAGLFAAQGILAALFVRERRGDGQRVDIGMLDATAALLTYQSANFFATGDTPVRLGNRHPTIAPYETFETSDGEMVIAVGNDAIWQRMCPALGLPNLAVDPRFSTNRDRLANYAELRSELDAAFRQRTREEWTARLRAVSVPCGSVRDIGEVVTDPQLAEREMIVTLMHPTAGATRVMGVPVKLSTTPGAVRMPPPTLGQHTEAVLGELEYDRQMIESLKADGAI